MCHEFGQVALHARIVSGSRVRLGVRENKSIDTSTREELTRTQKDLADDARATCKSRK